MHYKMIWHIKTQRKNKTTRTLISKLYLLLTFWYISFIFYVCVFKCACISTDIYIYIKGILLITKIGIHDRYIITSFSPQPNLAIYNKHWKRAVLGLRMKGWRTYWRHIKKWELGSKRRCCWAVVSLRVRVKKGLRTLPCWHNREE